LNRNADFNLLAVDGAHHKGFRLLQHPHRLAAGLGAEQAVEPADLATGLAGKGHRAHIVLIQGHRVARLQPVFAAQTKAQPLGLRSTGIIGAEAIARKQGIAG